MPFRTQTQKFKRDALRHAESVMGGFVSKDRLSRVYTARSVVHTFRSVGHTVNCVVHTARSVGHTIRSVGRTVSELCTTDARDRGAGHCAVSDADGQAQARRAQSRRIGDEAFHLER